MLKSLIAAIAFFTVNLAVTDGPAKAINGVIATLNQPGNIAVRITVGEANGVKIADEFTVRRNKQSHCLSSATITSLARSMIEYLPDAQLAIRRATRASRSVL